MALQYTINNIAMGGGEIPHITVDLTISVGNQSVSYKTHLDPRGKTNLQLKAELDAEIRQTVRRMQEAQSTESSLKQYEGQTFEVTL